MDITHKSTGCLIDEWITASFKIEYANSIEARKRHHDLAIAINSRLSAREFTHWQQLHDLIHALRAQSRQCWAAQEEIHAFIDFIYTDDIANDLSRMANIARAGYTAQKTNAQRNMLIRQIDILVEEQDISPLSKTYV